MNRDETGGGEVRGAVVHHLVPCLSISLASVAGPSESEDTLHRYLTSGLVHEGGTTTCDTRHREEMKSMKSDDEEAKRQR